MELAIRKPADERTYIRLRTNLSDTGLEYLLALERRVSANLDLLVSVWQHVYPTYPPIAFITSALDPFCLAATTKGAHSRAVPRPGGIGAQILATEGSIGLDTHLS